MSGITIEKLLGRQNYATWKIAARAWLELDDLWSAAVDYAVDAEGNPATPVNADKDRKARSKLVLSMDSVCYVHIQDAKSAREVWNKLAEAFEDNGLTRRIGLLRKLINTSLAASGSMEVYVNGIVTTAHALTGIGFKISDEWVAALLLAGLPEEYRPMIMAMENSGIKLTGDAVKTKLLQEMCPHENQQAFAMKNKGRGNFGKGVKCWNCGQHGHVSKDCRSKKNSNGRSGEALSAVLSAVGGYKEADWYFDSGATAHMTRSKNLISNETSASGGVMAADGKVMTVEAVGTVSLKPHCRDGELLPVTGVQFVPQLSANLLSVSQMVKKGHTVTFSKLGCEVRSSEGKLLATGSLTGDLFKLDQHADNRAMACEKVVSPSLWHRRMGHLNFQSLKKLRSGCASGINFGDEKNYDCRICPMGKQTRLKFNKEGSRASELLGDTI